ncbi:hypothetical protein CTI14_49100, partial [Methylobacterium radiotolerans]
PDLLTRNVAWEVTDLPRVWGDQEALSQVLTQLTENALKFTQSRDPATSRVEQSGRQMNTLIDGLLDLSTPPSGPCSQLGRPESTQAPDSDDPASPIC